MDSAFEALLEFLKRSRGFDFTGYKRTSLERRFKRRMESVGCKSYGDYLDFLEVHPDEYAVRVWSAGCASGQEAYTAAIVLAEVLGIEAYVGRVKIYATAIDEDA